VVKHVQSINGGGKSKLKPVSISTAEVLMHMAKEPEPPRWRSFVEVMMMHLTKETEPVTLKTRPTFKGLKELVMLTEKKRRAPVKISALKDGLKKPAMKVMGHAGSDLASNDGEDFSHFGESLERHSFINTLARLKVDVERC
jgi:hypothetical protein